jgi:plasmid stabilization system protein ParE
VKRRYKLTPQARTDLLTIWEFIAQDSVPAADRTRERLEKAFHLLAVFPLKGRRRTDVQTREAVLFWPVGSYVIVYKPAPRPIVIVRILHGARDLDALL